MTFSHQIGLISHIMIVKTVKWHLQKISGAKNIPNNYVYIYDESAVTHLLIDNN